MYSVTRCCRLIIYAASFVRVKRSNQNENCLWLSTSNGRLKYEEWVRRTIWNGAIARWHGPIKRVHTCFGSVVGFKCCSALLCSFTHIPMHVHLQQHFSIVLVFTFYSTTLCCFPVFFFCVFHFCTISVFQFTFSPLLRSIFIHLCMFTSALLYVFFLLAQATINLLQLTVFYSLSTPLTIFRLLKAEAVKA